MYYYVIGSCLYPIVFSNEKLGQTWITSNFDNLGKGASGAAIQNMNIMFNFPENL